MNSSFVAHALSMSVVLQNTKSSIKGLSTREATKRFKKNGPNILHAAPGVWGIVVFLRQLQNPLTLILVAAFAISVATAHGSDAIIISASVMVSASVSFLQERKANRAIAQLTALVHHSARVLRDGVLHVKGADEIVVGDIVELRAGEMVVADGRIISQRILQIIEAPLTGEASPSDKQEGVFAVDTSVGDRRNMAYSGTTVARGNGRMVVTSTGMDTQIGQVAQLVADVKEEETPLQRQLWKLGKTISIVLVVLVTIVFGIGVLSGVPVIDMFLTAIAMLVSAVPEGLLPALTVILAIGMQRLSHRHALVRKMLAAETLGSVTVICTDKTGTLTQGEMRVQSIETPQVVYERPQWINKSYRNISNGALSEILTAVMLCNTAVIKNSRLGVSRWQITADATEKALVMAAGEAGLQKMELEKQFPIREELPFDSAYKYMAIVHRLPKPNGAHAWMMIAKGAPERLMPRCEFFDDNGVLTPLTSSERKKIITRITKHTRKGYRVLLIAQRVVRGLEPITHESINKLVLLGWCVLSDPLRAESKQTIEQCRQAGIRPVLVTGDHRLTAVAIAKEIGMETGVRQVMQGDVLDRLTDSQLRKIVGSVNVFARVEPKHKLRIVEALQANGEVVAMTGDGVNDAPSLKRADIGVAVGSGTDVAKETADVVLLDNNFATIVEAVRRGRILFYNIRKVVVYCLADGLTETIIIVASVMAGLPLPLLPAQILWINLILDSTPAMALAFDEIEEDVMHEVPRSPNEPILDRSAFIRIGWFAAVMNSTLFGLYYYFLQVSQNVIYARTITFLGFGMASLLLIYAVRGFRRSIFFMNPFSNRWLSCSTLLGLGLFVVALYVPFFQNLLSVIPMGVFEWSVVVAYGVFGVLVYETGKWFTS